jgi:hypothetical protein
MRTVKMFVVALPLLLWAGAFIPGQMLVSDSGVALAAQEDPPAAAPAEPAAPAAPPDINVTVDNGGEKRIMFFANPWVLAAAGIGLLIAIALIAMSTRGGGTTIIREK